MSAQPSFSDRLLEVALPTSVQILACSFLSMLILTLTQTQSIIQRLGITDAQLSASSTQFHDRFDAVLRSNIASQTALITFWAAVGLVAYLICWGMYNLLIEARNEVTLNTAYTNRGRWQGVKEKLAIKASAALFLVLMIWSLRYGASFWLALSARFIDHLSVGSVLAAVASLVGLAVQLYLVLAFILLTFTPWYRIQTFTDV